MDGLFWTEKLTPDQQLTPEMLARDKNDFELALCTGHLVFVSLFYMIMTAGHRLRNKIARWTTDATVATNA